MKNPTVELQIEIESVYSKHQLIEVLREEFDAISETPFHSDMLAQIWLHRQADPVTMVGLLSPKYGTPQEVALLLLDAANDDLIDFEESAGKFMVKYELSDDVVERLELYQYPMPMVIAPRKVECNRDTGYLSIDKSVVLNGSHYFMDKDMCLDHLNRANSVALALDMDVVNSIQGKHQIPKRNIGEDYDEYLKRKRQARVFFTQSAKIMGDLDSITDEIYLTHRYDRRGRCYSSGYHINTQGTDYNKAVLQLAKKELVT